MSGLLTRLEGAQKQSLERKHQSPEIPKLEDVVHIYIYIWICIYTGIPTISVAISMFLALFVSAKWCVFKRRQVGFCMLPPNHEELLLRSHPKTRTRGWRRVSSEVEVPPPLFPQVLAPKNRQNFWKIFDGLGMPTYIYLYIYIYKNKHINLYLPLLLWAGGGQSNLWAWKWFCHLLPVVTIEFDRMRLSTWRLKGQEKGCSETCFHDIWNQRNGL